MGHFLPFALRVAIYFPALLFLLPLILHKSPLTLFPGPENYQVSTYSDSTEGGHSTSMLSEITDTSLGYYFTLRSVPGKDWMDPYTGLSFMLKKENGPVDISAFDYLLMDIECRQSQSFIIHLKTEIEGFTDPDNWRTFYFESQSVPIHLGSNSYRLPLKNFSKPIWWSKVSEQAEANLPEKADYTKMLGIDIQNGYVETRNIRKKVTIRRIAFVQEVSVYSLVIASGFILYPLVLFLFLYYPKGRNSGFFPYTRIKIKNRTDISADRIADFIGSHFQNPELTVDLVARETGIASSRISVILQKQHNHSFKQYLNNIRVAESKRLLRETDRTISEIAFTVGYNNVTHFNRVFRNTENISPSEFRGGSNAS